MTKESSGLIVEAWELDGSGGGKTTDTPPTGPETTPAWIHMDRTHAQARAWLESESEPLGLDRRVIDALLAEDTRPRVLVRPRGLLVNMRGVNLNSDAAPEEMVALRLWLTRDTVLTLRKFVLMSVRDVQEELRASGGPQTCAAVMTEIADRIVTRIGAHNDELFGLLETAERDTGSATRRLNRLSELRREATAIRRYLAPQISAFNKLTTLEHPALDDAARADLVEIADDLTRHDEDLDELIDRAAIEHEELTLALADRTNRATYLLSLAGGLFLPLGFLTGLLGINVGGIPLADSADGFLIVAGIMIALAIGSVATFKLARWL